MSQTLRGAAWAACGRKQDWNSRKLFASLRLMATDVQAHITGTVWKIEVHEGDRVDAGSILVILESMKMELPLESEVAGTVSKIVVKEGQSVQEGDKLLVID